MNQKAIWKEIIIYFVFSQIISFTCYLQIRVPEYIFSGIWRTIFSAFPTNMLFWYTLALIYRIVFIDIKKIKFVSLALEILFYVDFFPKFGMSIFAALFFKGNINLGESVANIILLIFFVIDILIEMLIVVGFYKLENGEYAERKDRTINVDSMQCTYKEYEKMQTKLLLFLLTYILPFLYCALYGENIVYVLLYLIFCIAIHSKIYVKMKKEYTLLFEHPKYILRAFLFEISSHLTMFLVCVLDIEKPIAINYIIVLGLIVNIYCFLRIEYQIVKVIRKMEKYLKDIK